MSLSPIRLASGVTLITLISAAPASASSFYVQQQSVRGAGRSYSGEVADKGVDSLWWNPASIAGLDQNQSYAGLNLILVNSKVTDRGSNIARSTSQGALNTSVGGARLADDPIRNGLLPNGGAAIRANDQLSLGVSIAAPYNFTSQHDADSWTRYDAVKSRLLTVNIDGVIAYRVNDVVDLGAGLSALYADAELTNALPNLSPLQPDGDQSLKGDGWAYGFTAGFQARPSQALTIGASYRSKIDQKLNGTVRVAGLLAPIPASTNVSATGQTRITLPWIASVGARWSATDRWTLNASLSRTGWKEFEAIRVTFAGTQSATPLYYKNVTSYAFGVDYQASPQLTLRAGVQHEPTPTPDVGRGARFLDGDRMMYAAGATFFVTDSTKLDIAISHVRLEKSRINRTVDTVTGPIVYLTGDVTGSAFVLSTGARFSF